MMLMHYANAEVNVMSKSEVNIYEGRAPTQHEIARVSSPHKIGVYKEIVSKFYESKKPIWTYPVPQGVNGSTYLSGFKRAISTLGYEGKISVHGCKSDKIDAIILKREE